LTANPVWSHRSVAALTGDRRVRNVLPASVARTAEAVFVLAPAAFGAAALS